MNAARAAGNTRVHQEILVSACSSRRSALRGRAGPLGRRRVAARPRFLLLVILVADEEEREHSQNAADENSDGFALHENNNNTHINHVTPEFPGCVTRFKTTVMIFTFSLFIVNMKPHRCVFIVTSES